MKNKIINIALIFSLITIPSYADFAFTDESDFTGEAFFRPAGEQPVSSSKKTSSSNSSKKTSSKVQNSSTVQNTVVKGDYQYNSNLNIEDNVFIGSNVNFVAPVTVHEYAKIGAGSTITKEVPAESLGIARARQVVLENKGVKKHD